ncbi:MAG: DUF4281 domain-containing protein [Pseudomonadota bacterium]|nr:DUF4281 domain-containing protein [Pseudomonadota bacterium]
MEMLSGIDPAEVFHGASLLALLGWLMLMAGAISPPGSMRERCLHMGGTWVPVLLSAVYALILARYSGSAPNGHFGSLEGVSLLFAAPGKLLGGWIHFLAFDLLAGAWVVRDVLASSRSRGWLLLALPLLFLFGPLGWLLYAAARRLPPPLTTADS